MLAIEAHIEDNDGYCTTCKEWTAQGGCEPDARRYTCEQCGKPTVYGAEECIIMGLACAYEAAEGDE
jgi:Zn finger protein HypA/HybF involved in hydrogenase expression